MRVAIYYTPDAGHPLARAAAEWLGRATTKSRPGNHSQLGEVVMLERGAGPDDLVAEPRRYGFHATLKAPFRLADGCTVEQVAAALEDFCLSHSAPPLGPLKIADLGNFIALVPDASRPDLQGLAADVVRAFEPFRAPLNDAELARRLASRLTTRQEHNLRRFGYPYVLENFHFHMTLTGRVAENCRTVVVEMLQERFNPLLDSVPKLDSLALFLEPAPGADFEVYQIVRLAR